MKQYQKNMVYESTQRSRIREWKLLFRSIPSMVVALFVVSVICMNLLANKTIVQTEWLALDGGIVVSWLAFLCMDVITKHFGPKASTGVAIFAASVNVFTSLVFYLVSIIPSTADDYTALNTIFGGTWFILLGSTIAFLVSAVINNVLNWSIGGLFRKNPDGKLAFVTRSYVSTFIGQFVDNFLFATLVFMAFAPIFWDGFHWTLLQCTTCAITGALAELLMEVVFSPIGYRVAKRWKREAVGQEYLKYMGETK